MSWNAIKRGPLDALFSDFIRMKHRWRCFKCNTYFPPGQARKGLHNAHMVVGRGKGNSTRWLEEDCVPLCYGHHQYFTAHPAEAMEWFIKTFGQERYDLVRFMARQIVKSWELKDLKAAKAVYFKAEMERMAKEGYEPPAKWKAPTKEVPA